MGDKIVLYIGADDSNHAGQNKKGEIILATFSRCREDGLVVKQINRRDIQETQKWVAAPERDYRFAIITHETQTRGDWDANKAYNLVLLAPLLIKNYLAANRDSNIGSLKIFLDGAMEGYQRRFIKNDFSGYSDCVVDNFNKKQRTPKGKLCPSIVCPRVVKEADTLANMLFNRPWGDMVKDKNFVYIDPQILIERERAMKSFDTKSQ